MEGIQLHKLVKVNQSDQEMTHVSHDEIASANLKHSVAHLLGSKDDIRRALTSWNDVDEVILLIGIDSSRVTSFRNSMTC